MLYRSASEIDFDLGDLATMDLPGRVLMARPDHFDVKYVINPHMAGNIGKVDVADARTQWDTILREYESLGVDVAVVEGVEDLPDMVFCANQTLPYRLRDGSPGVVLSRMHSPHRAPEVTHFDRFFRAQGYESVSLPEEIGDFEGMGDALWHAGRCLLWGGYGFRSSLRAYEFLADHLGVKIAVLRLEDPDFYHLDTCLSIINESVALVFPGAFQHDGLGLITRLFTQVVEAPELEARELFACNAHSPDGQHVIIQKGCVETIRRLRAAGLTPIEVQTDQFLKAGGSVFCMKQMFW